jgi:hypothetical protein
MSVLELRVPEEQPCEAEPPSRVVLGRLADRAHRPTVPTARDLLDRRVLERTFAWLDQFRRLRVRYDKRPDIHEAFLSLGCALICWQALRKMEGRLSRCHPSRRWFADTAFFSGQSRPCGCSGASRRGKPSSIGLHYGVYEE